MKNTDQTYLQPTKEVARLIAIKRAVTLMTTNRCDAAIVPEDYVERVRDRLLKSDVGHDAAFSSACDEADFASWKSYRKQFVGAKTPSELKVAYLAGPEPTHDLQIFIDLGVRPENIWAFELPKHFEFTLTDLKENPVRGVKALPMKIQAFFRSSPVRFDIIYFDACGPVPSRQQQTTQALVDLFRYCALEPLGTLITNFAMPDMTKADTADNFGTLVSAYLFPKCFLDRPDGSLSEGPSCHGKVLRDDDNPDESFYHEVLENFEHFYGTFITRHIRDIATIVSPTLRLHGTEARPILFSVDAEKAAERALRYLAFTEASFTDNASIDDANYIDMDGDAITDSDHYSILWTLGACGAFPTDENFERPPKSTVKFLKDWIRQLGGSADSKISAKTVIGAFYAWRSEKAFWSDAMSEMGDHANRLQMPMFCDVPTDEIGFFPAFAQLAFPSHGNIKQAERFHYVAEGKSTQMFMDVMVFDECRYVYDWMSGVHMLTDDWRDLSQQLTFRFALDAIAKDNRWYGDDFLFGCHVVGIDNDFDASELSPRYKLASPDISKGQ